MNNDNLHIDIDLITRSLAGETTPEETDYVIKWKEASAENLAEYKEFENVWKAMDKTSVNQNIDIDKEWEYQQSLIKPTSRTITFMPFLKYAASILIIIGASYFGWNYLSNKSIKSNISETKDITLPDGSQVTLNANSKLIYTKDYGKKLREVTLNGEAFFKVTKNPKLPFIVKINDAEIKVLGTSFNVREFSETDKVEVTVSEGTVSVYKKGNELKKVIITKGEKAIYSEDVAEITKLNNNDRNYIAWKTKLVVFENDSLPAIARTLSNVYHVEFVLQNKELNRCSATTIFENKNLKTVLDVLKSTMDITIEEKDGKIYIKGKGC